MTMRMIHLKVGWNTQGFDEIVTTVLKDNDDIYEYYDIKIDSKGENCMLILKEKGARK
jgi:hypothetical protein